MSIHQAYFKDPSTDAIIIIREFDTIDEAYEFMLDNSYNHTGTSTEMYVRSVYDPLETLEEVDDEYGLF